MTLNPIKNILLLAAALWFPAVMIAAAPTDLLWQKAVALAGTNADWVAGLVVMRSEVIYKGETNGIHEIWTRSTAGTNGEVITDTVKILEDGKDVTAKEKKKEKDKAKKTKGQGSGPSNPFSAATQDRLSLASTNRTRTIEGKVCAGYLFAVKETNGMTMAGVAWLEKDTGVPVELEDVTLIPLPDKRVKGLKITTRYESTADGVWRAREVLTIGKVSAFFINAEFHSVMKFSEYWKTPSDR